VPIAPDRLRARDAAASHRKRNRLDNEVECAGCALARMRLNKQSWRGVARRGGAGTGGGERGEKSLIGVGSNIMVLSHRLTDRNLSPLQCDFLFLLFSSSFTMS
jgi:hypothetical protein